MIPANDSDASPDDAIAQDPAFQQQVKRLHRFRLYSRWLTVGVLWLLVAPLSLWALRTEIALWQDYFTWAALRYALIYNRLPAIGLGLCLGLPIATLIWQSRNILLGWSPAYQRQLEKQVLWIRQQGKSHPLWKWICKS